MYKKAIITLFCVGACGLTACGAAPPEDESAGTMPTDEPVGSEQSALISPALGRSPAAKPRAVTRTLDTGTATLQPGAEAFFCQQFANPFGGQDTAITESTTTTSSPGLTETFLFDASSYDQNTNAFASCSSESQLQPYVHFGEAGTTTFSYPANVGVLLKGTAGVLIQAHFANFGSTAARVQVAASLNGVAANTVANLAEPIYLNDTGLRVPPGMSTASSQFTVPFDIKMLWAVEHMHQRGTHFAATAASQTLCQGTQWNSPPISTFTTPLDVPSGPLTWACTYNDTTPTVLSFGPTLTSEECYFTGMFYAGAAANQGSPLSSF